LRQGFVSQRTNAHQQRQISEISHKLERRMGAFSTYRFTELS
jgi:hypothetical protein